MATFNEFGIPDEKQEKHAQYRSIEAVLQFFQSTASKYVVVIARNAIKYNPEQGDQNQPQPQIIIVIDGDFIPMFACLNVIFAKEK